MPKMTFEDWWRETQQEAYRRAVGFLLGDKDSHRDSYEDGLSPAEEIENQIDAARASQ